MWPFQKEMLVPESILAWFKLDSKAASDLPVLHCEKCSAAYDFNKNAMVNTYTLERPMFLKETMATSKRSSRGGATRPPEDTVMETTCEAAKIKRNVLYSVLTQLRKGNVRKWYCTKCHHLQNYPKSFTR